MGKFLKFSLISVVIVSLAFSVYKISGRYRINILKDDIDCTIITKGVENTKAITVDNNGGIYIAYDDSIKEIDNEGKIKLIYRDKNERIEDIGYSRGNLYFISGERIGKISLKDKSLQIIVDKIPSAGNGIDRKLLISDDKAYLTIGSTTNSGVSDDEKYDLSPFDINLNGVNYGEKKTGAFKPNGVSSEGEETIKKSSLGNATVYEVDLTNGALTLYASGIRGVTGIDYDSGNNIMAIFSGMENIGLRPVDRDRDYIYKLQKGQWYGWPDFSGGDPISSPRFKGKDTVKPLIKNPPKKVVEAPLYQHSSVDALRGMAIDREGTVFKKDSIVTWDRNENVIGVLDSDNIYTKIIKIGEGSKLEDIVYNGDEVLVLDSQVGCIYSIHSKEGILGFKLPIMAWLFIISLAFILLMVFVYKAARKEN